MAKNPHKKSYFDSKNKKRNNKRKSLPKWLKIVFTVFITLFSIAIICGAVAGTYVYNFAKQYVEGEKKIDLDDYKANQEQTSIIYAYDSDDNLVELLRLHGAENRVWINYDEIPKTLVDAFRDLEDKRFKEHHGVDWIRTIGGVAKSGFKEGGSTITQQLIKNLTGENGRTVSRKFYEILNALNVERFYNKDTIMEFYLNTVYLGNGCYGIKTAAEKYFGKNVEDLNVAECAVIASITQFPAEQDPLYDPDSVTARKLLCLDYMLEAGDIDEEEYKNACDYELIYTNSENYAGSTVSEDPEEDEEEYTEEDVRFKDSGESSYYVEYVIDKVIADLQKEYNWTYNEAWRKVFFGGLRIYSAVDLNVQRAAEDVYVNRETMPEEEDTEEEPAAQSSITIMDYSGRVVGMVGGTGEKEAFRGLNRATDSPRQPGSSIKPLSVYAPCIENNICTYSTKVQNYGIRLGSSRWPRNFGGVTGSPTEFVTVQYAVAESLNTVPAQLVREIGISPCLDFLVDDLHFTTLVTDENDDDYDGNYSSICVGGMSHGVTTLEMAAAYAMFGNNGYYFAPYCYYKVTNNDGSEILLEDGDNPGTQVLSESSAGVMRQLLRTVVTMGTGGSYAVSGFETFAKTGTTTDDKDRWFVGGTPYYVAAVWYGYDEPRAITNTWGNPAGKLFNAVMETAHEGLEEKTYPTANDMVARRYCTITGDIASDTCASTALGYYKTSNIPSTCKNCAMIHAIGSEIPDEVTKPSATTTQKPTTTEALSASTTKPDEQSTESDTTEPPENDEPATVAPRIDDGDTLSAPASE